MNEVTHLRIVPLIGLRNTVEVWERLETKAPCPDKTAPYCCLVNTVIFYVGPQYVLRPWHRIYEKPIGPYKYEKPNREYQEWDRVEYLLQWDTPIDINGAKFIVGGGKVIWKRPYWWMKHWARRAA